MQVVIDFAKGLIGDEEFELLTYSDNEIWNYIQSLVPKDIYDRTCKFRDYYGNMQGFETNNYNVKATVTSFGYNAFFARSLISKLVKYNFPDVEIHEPIKSTPDDLLEKIGLDYLGGSDADGIVRAIMLQHNGASQKVIKEALKTVFGIKSAKHRPHWVQEPEWPVINGKPMLFVNEKVEGELHTYLFIDNESGKNVVIEQYT